MNIIDFSKTGGYRFKQNSLAKMQDTYYEMWAAFVSFLKVPSIGNFILSGCEITAGVISDGYMYIDGDLCKFSSVIGTTATTIKKLEILEPLPFKDGTNPLVFRSVTAVVDAAGTPLSDFVTIELDFDVIKNIPQFIIDPANLTNVPPDKTVLERITELEKKTAIFTANGVVFPWRKDRSLIPHGFQEVIDLRGKTVFGMDVTLNPDGTYKNPEFAPVTAGMNDPGRTGGNKTHTLIKAELPSYNLEYHVGVETVNGGAENIRSSNAGGAYIDEIPSGGGDQPFSLLPPFETVIFIEYIG